MNLAFGCTTATSAITCSQEWWGDTRLNHKDSAKNVYLFKKGTIIRKRFIVTTLVFATTTIAFDVSPARAADSCQPVFDALMKVATTPSHSYTTDTAVNGGKAEAETIFANGQKYILARGKWMRIPVTSQNVVDQEKEKQQRGTSACQLLRSEPVNGEGAMLYSVHREYAEVKEDGQMWISRSSGLLLRAEEDFDNRGTKVKDHRSTRFEYGNVRPPLYAAPNVPTTIRRRRNK